MSGQRTKIDDLYDALKKDGAVSKSREYFNSKMLAPGEEGYKNRLQLYNALKEDGAIESETYEEFASKLGLHAVEKGAAKDDGTQTATASPSDQQQSKPQNNTQSAAKAGGQQNAKQSAQQSVPSQYVTPSKDPKETAQRLLNENKSVEATNMPPQASRNNPTQQKNVMPLEQRKKLWTWQNITIPTTEAEYKTFMRRLKEEDKRVKDRNDPDEIEAFKGFVNDLSKEQIRIKKGGKVAVKTGNRSFGEGDGLEVRPFGYSKADFSKELQGQDYVLTVRTMAQAKPIYNLEYNVKDPEVRKDYEVLKWQGEGGLPYTVTDYMIDAAPKDKAKYYNLYAAYIYDQVGEIPDWVDYQDALRIRALDKSQLDKDSKEFVRLAEETKDKRKVRGANNVADYYNNLFFLKNGDRRIGNGVSYAPIVSGDGSLQIVAVDVTGRPTVADNRAAYNNLFKQSNEGLVGSGKPKVEMLPTGRAYAVPDITNEERYYANIPKWKDLSDAERAPYKDEVDYIYQMQRGQAKQGVYYVEPGQNVEVEAAKYAKRLAQDQYKLLTDKEKMQAALKQAKDTYKQLEDVQRSIFEKNQKFVHVGEEGIVLSPAYYELKSLLERYKNFIDVAPRYMEGRHYSAALQFWNGLTDIDGATFGLAGLIDAANMNLVATNPPKELIEKFGSKKAAEKVIATAIAMKNKTEEFKTELGAYGESHSLGALMQFFMLSSTPLFRATDAVGGFVTRRTARFLGKLSKGLGKLTPKATQSLAAEGTKLVDVGFKEGIRAAAQEGGLCGASTYALGRVGAPVRTVTSQVLGKGVQGSLEGAVLSVPKVFADVYNNRTGQANITAETREGIEVDSEHPFTHYGLKSDEAVAKDAFMREWSQWVGMRLGEVVGCPLSRAVDGKVAAGAKKAWDATMGKFVNTSSYQKISGFFSKMKKSAEIGKAITDVGKYVGENMKRAGMGGTMTFYAQTNLSEMLNAMTVGDVKWDQIASIPEQVDKLWGAAVSNAFMVGIHNVVGTAGYYKQKRDLARHLTESDARGLEAWGKEDWDGIKSDIETLSQSDKNLQAYAQGVLGNEKLTDAQKSAIMDYATTVLTQKTFGLIASQGEGKNKPNEYDLRYDDAYNAGYQVKSPDEMSRMRESLDAARKTLAEKMGITAEEVDAAFSDGSKTLGEKYNEAVKNYTETHNADGTAPKLVEEFERALDQYFTAMSAQRGVSEALVDSETEAVRRTDAIIDRSTNDKTGVIEHGVDSNGRQCIVVSGDPKSEDKSQMLVVVYADNGEVKGVPTNEITVTRQSDPQEAKDQQIDAIHANYENTRKSIADGTTFPEQGDKIVLYDGENKKTVTIDGVRQEQTNEGVKNFVEVTTEDGIKRSLPEEVYRQYAKAGFEKTSADWVYGEGRYANESERRNPEEQSEDPTQLTGEGTSESGNSDSPKGAPTWSVDTESSEIKVGETFVDSDGKRFTVKSVDGDKFVVVDGEGNEQTYEDGIFNQMVENGLLKRDASENTASTWGVGSKLEINGHEYKVLRVDEANDRVYLEDENGEAMQLPWVLSGLNDSIKNGRAHVIEDTGESPNGNEEVSTSSGEGQGESAGNPANAQPGVVPTESVTPGTAQTDPMPMRTVGKGKNARQEEDWLATSPQRGHDYIFGETGLDADEANAFVENMAAEAKKNLEKVQKNAPKMGTSISEYKAAKTEHEALVAEAQKAVDYWNDVKAVHAKRAFEAEKPKEEGAASVDSAHKVDERISQKWNDAKKVDGDADEITLPNGETVKGHYVLTESGAASASHQANNGFAETEGFPVDENGQSVNDRDYKRDQEAQQITRGMAQDYDSRALQSPVVVSKDGVVLSGNGRTMAGEIAAENGTDTKYNDYLRAHANKYGFTEEQVNGFEHPRVVFVPDADMPYTADTFAKFNQREQKSQSKTEQAVKMGKVVDDALFGRVMQTIGTYDTLGEFYGDDAATHAVVKELAGAGVIPQTEMANLFDGGKLSEAGQAMVEGVLIGKVFQGNPDAVREITEVKSMRQSVMTALQDIVQNNRLGGGYSLSSELADAVDLVYKARKAGYKAGMRVSEYAGQGQLFQLEDGATVADYTNAAVMMLADVLNDGRTTQLKKVMSFYNQQAADAAQGIGDMFAGGVKTKEQIINEVNEALNNGQNYNRKSASASDGQGRGSQGGEQGDAVGSGDQGGEQRKQQLRKDFNELASNLKTAQGEERQRILGRMRDTITQYAEENGYPKPEFLLTEEEFLNAAPEKDLEIYKDLISRGVHMPAYYEKGKVYFYIKGCEDFDRDVVETIAHEYTHADNAEFPECVNMLTYAIEDTHEVTQDELIDILESLSSSTIYEEKAERIESEGKNPNKMLADEVIAHSVARMIVDGEQVLDGITKNPTLQAVIKRAYKLREDERQHNIHTNNNAKRTDKKIQGTEGSRTNNGKVDEGKSPNGRSRNSDESIGHSEGTAEGSGQPGVDSEAKSSDGGYTTDQILITGQMGGGGTAHHFGNAELKNDQNYQTEQKHGVAKGKMAFTDDPRSVRTDEGMVGATSEIAFTKDGKRMIIPENFDDNEGGGNDAPLFKATGRNDFEMVTFPKGLSEAERNAAVDYVKGQKAKTWDEFAKGLVDAVNHAEKKSLREADGAEVAEEQSSGPSLFGEPLHKENESSEQEQTQTVEQSQGESGDVQTESGRLPGRSSGDRKYAEGSGNDEKSVRMRKATERVAEMLGTKVVWDDTIEKSNGYYDPKTNTIHVAKDAGNPLEAVFGHESLHRVRSLSEDAYNSLLNAVKKFVGEDAFKEAAQKKYDFYNSHGVKTSMDGAAEEVVGDEVGRMLDDKDYAEKLAYNLKHPVLSAIKDFLTQIKDAIVKAFGGGSEEARKVNDLLRTINKAYRKAVKEADRKPLKAGEDILMENGKVAAQVDGELNVRPSLSLRTYNDWTDEHGVEHQGTRGRMVDFLTNKGFDKRDIDRMTENMDYWHGLMQKVADFVGEDGRFKFPAFHEWSQSTPLYRKYEDSVTRAVSTLVNNGEYPLNFELTTDCIKREAFTQILNEMLNLDDAAWRKLTPAKISDIQTLEKSYGIQVACPLCFVEGKRLNIMKWATSVVKKWNQAVADVTGDKKTSPFGFGKGTYVPEEVIRDGNVNYNSDVVRQVNEVDRMIQSREGVLPEVLKQMKQNDEELRQKLEQFRDEYAVKHGSIDGFRLTDKQEKELVKLRNQNLRGAVARMAKAIAAYPELRHRLQVEDLVGSKGLMAIRAQDSPAFAEMYSSIVAANGTGTPKLVQDSQAYDGEIIDVSDTQFNNASVVGGARLFSFSDFDLTKVFDIMQIMWDCAARNAKVQSYSKEVPYIVLFGKCGVKINMSMLPEARPEEGLVRAYKDGKNKTIRDAALHAIRENAGLEMDKDGHIKGIQLSDSHSVSKEFAESIFHNDDYNANCGAIMVGISVNHTIYSMCQDFIRQVIPFHLSGMPIASRKRSDCIYYRDATNEQNTGIIDKDGKRVKLFDQHGKSRNPKVDHDFNFYEGEDKPGWNMRDRCREYIKWCQENGCIPRFEWAVNSDGYRAFCEREGYKPNEEIIRMMDERTTDGIFDEYYKVITDYTAYQPIFDENGNMIGERPAPHKPVSQDLNIDKKALPLVLGVDENGKLVDDQSMLANREKSIANASQNKKEIAQKAVMILNGTAKVGDLVNKSGTEFENNSDSDKYLGGNKKYSLREDETFKSPNEMSDEEKSERGQKLINAPAIEVKSNQIVKTENMSARRVAEKWWNENVGDSLFYDTEVGKVEINENSIGSSLAHRYGQAKLDAITSLKDGFKNAVYLGTIPDFVRQEGVQNHYFAYPIIYNGKRNYVFCRAMQDANKNRLYVHEVFIADKLQNEGNTLQTAASQPHGGIALYKAILSDVLSTAKVGNNSESSNISDENSGKRFSLREGDDEQPTGGVAKKDRVKQIVEDTMERLAKLNEEKNEKRADAKAEAAKAVGGTLRAINKAMSAQREYDLHTVDSITKLAKDMLKHGLLHGLSDYEASRLFSAATNVHGKKDIKPYVQKVMDIMVNNQLGNLKDGLSKLLMMRGKKVNASGVEVQGGLDLDGQHLADTVWHGLGMTEEDIQTQMADAQDRMGDENRVIAHNAEVEYQAYRILQNYHDGVVKSKSEEQALRQELKKAKEDYDAKRMSFDDYVEFREATENAIRENRMDRIEAYRDVMASLGGEYGESAKRAKEFRESEKERINEIHHNANSDMEGRPAEEHHQPTKVDKAANNPLLRILTAPLGTFDQMLRMFGRKNVRGEGYLWNRYMRGWNDARDNEVKGYRGAIEELDNKVKEVFGRKGMKWSDLFALERKLPKGYVSFMDGGEKKTHELTQGNLLYIYMVNKMTDGKMKLRKMGISEEDVKQIEDFLDPRLKQIGDWLQDEYLVKKREKYNEVHEKLFGASMADIDNYFPLKILKNAITQDVNLEDRGQGDEKVSTIVGSVKKRTRNALPLDVMNADAFAVVLEHLKDMEHFAAFGEWNRDLNTLLSYNRFRVQVENMASVYGSGKKLWKAFENVCQIAAGVYQKGTNTFDRSLMAVAKGVTGAKVTGRIFTAFKQLTSYPAYLSEANPIYLIRNLVNPVDAYNAWKWSMENLPQLRERWQGRFAGDPILESNRSEGGGQKGTWERWRENVIELAAKYGMSPNAFVDALTISMGTQAVYKTRLAKYKQMGYSDEAADKRAKQDASIAYNQTQQSSEGAYMSAIQSDRTWATAMFTAFRNSSISYTRQLYDALRRMKDRFTPGYKGLTVEFMRKQMERDGIDPDKASENAKKEYRRGFARDMVRIGVFGYLLQLTWNMIGYAPYLLFGDDDKKKKEMWSDIFTHTMFGSIEGLVGGDALSAGFNSLWRSVFNGEDFDSNKFSKDMPVASDIDTMWRDWKNKGWQVGVTDVFNILVQSAIGVNPQTLTDAAAAIYDYCGADEVTPRECALLVMRIFNCPKSQTDKVYFDELGMTAKEAQKLSVGQIAERYANYKMRSDAPVLSMTYGDDEKKERGSFYRDKAVDAAKENLGYDVSSKEVTDMQNEYAEMKKKVQKIKDLEDEDRDEYLKQMGELVKTPEYRRYKVAARYNGEMNKLTKKFMRAKTTDERKAVINEMQSTRDRWLKVLNSPSE